MYWFTSCKSRHACFMNWKSSGPIAPQTMKINILSPANKMPDWVNTATDEFLKRLDDSIKVNFQDIPLNTRGKNADLQRLMEKEARDMLKHIRDDDWVVALTIDGKQY